MTEAKKPHFNMYKIIFVHFGCNQWTTEQIIAHSHRAAAAIILQKYNKKIKIVSIKKAE